MCWCQTTWLMTTELYSRRHLTLKAQVTTVITSLFEWNFTAQSCWLSILMCYIACCVYLHRSHLFIGYNKSSVLLDMEFKRKLKIYQLLLNGCEMFFFPGILFGSQCICVTLRQLWIKIHFFPQILPKRQWSTSPSCPSDACPSRDLSQGPLSAKPCPPPTRSCWCSMARIQLQRLPSDNSTSLPSRSSSLQWRRAPSSFQASLK